jgi:hypothetical protein
MALSLDAELGGAFGLRRLGAALVVGLDYAAMIVYKPTQTICP